jgi:outer membrane protein insertion porin family
MLLKILKIFSVFLLVSSGLYAQFGGMPAQGSSLEESVQKYNIAGISVEGNKYSDSETIITLSGLRVGEDIQYPFDPKIQSAIQNIWDRKQFSNVKLTVDNITPVGVFLRIEVEEYSRLNKIIIENNDELDDFDIEEATGKIRGDIISNYDLYLMEQNIKKKYAEEGLLYAKVEIDKQETENPGYIDLSIYVEEGIEFRVRSVTFEGNEFIDDKELKKSFEETKEKSWWRFWRSAKFDNDKFDEDLELLVKHYKSQGFIDAAVLQDTIVYDEEEERVDIRVKVDEGQKVYVRNITFEGNTVYPDKILKDRLEFKKGDPYDMTKFEMNLLGNENQSDASSLYLDNGYLQAMLQPKEIRVASDTVDIVVNVYENDRYTINKVKIVGNSKTKDKVIRRELYTRPGDYFDRSAIIRSIRALGVLQYFNPEGLQPDVQPSATDATAVDIIYKVEERSTDTFNASVGFAGSFGLTGAVGLTFNNFSITEPLKGGGGQIFNFNWEFGQANRYRTFSLGFTEPWLMDEPTTVGFNIFDTYYNFSTLEQRRTGVALNFGRRFKWPDDYWRGDWSLRYILNDNATSSIYYREGKYSEVTLGQRISRISINNTFFPSRGSKFTFSNDLAMGALNIGATDYLKTELKFEMYNPLWQVENSDKLVFMMSSEFGYITGISTDTTISQIELYRMGGNGLGGFNVTPLRGYPDNEVGNRTGNRLMSKYTAELRFAVALDPMPVYLYGFAEAGNVWTDLNRSDIFDLKRAAGVGVQMMINPIGIIGFSYGYGFDTYGTSETVSGWKFLFHLGQY